MQQYLTDTSLGAVNINDYTGGASNQMQALYGAQNWQVYPIYDELRKMKQKLEIEKPFVDKKIESKKEKKMAIGKNKRGLFQVILVDPKKKEMLLNTMVIADTIEDVLLEVDAGKIIKDKNLQVSEVDKIVNILGEIRKTRKSKDTGELEIITEETKE